MNKFTVEYFARQLLKELHSTEAFKSLTEDTLVYEFYVGKVALTTQIKNALGISKEDNSPEVTSAVNTFFRQLKTAFKESESYSTKRYYIKELKSTRYSFKVQIIAPSSKSNVNQWITRKIAPAKKELFNEVSKLSSKELESNKFLSSVNTSQVQDLSKDINDFFKSGNPITKKSIDKFILEVKSNLSNKSPLINVSLSSAATKNKWSRLSDRTLYSKLSKTIVESSTTLVTPAVQQHAENEIYTAFNKGLKGVPGVTTSGLNNTKIVDKDIKQSINTNTINTSASYSKVTNSLVDSLDLNSLLAYINKELVGQIRGNMGSPRLNWRTGRFAGSAKAISAYKDSRDEVALEYTYMLYPYQTFEPGFKQGSRERDPRPLIERSIRQIAVEITNTKFNFRRV